MTLKDSLGQPIAPSALSTLTLTFYDLANPTTIMNNRNHQNVLNTNNCTLNSNGNFVWAAQPADTTLLSQNSAIEYREALIEWTGAADTIGSGKYVIRLAIQNLTNVS